MKSNFIPAPGDIAFFQQHGWYVSPIVLPGDVIDEAYHGALRHYAGERDNQLPLSGGYLDWKEEHGNILRMNDYVSLQNDGIKKLVEEPVIGCIAAKLAGCNEIRLFHDQLILKPPLKIAPGAVVGWHTDKAYWKTCTSNNMLTAWIPFQDCSMETGTLCVVDKSHLWNDTDHLNTFSHLNIDQLHELISNPARDINIVPMVLKKGQISFHHCKTIHGSYPNYSDNDRIALAVHLQDEMNEYEQRYAGDKTVLHINDLLCRKTEAGFPDYRDPDVCKTLWNQPD
jgi:ectoine hydroxylase-related dioxygenase (phytanoyl-CoA dioxygenase family)